MNLDFTKTFKSCCTWLFFGLLFMGFSPDAFAHYLTIKNEGNCAVNIYQWVTTGDIYETIIQPGQDYKLTGLNGHKYRAVDTNNDWNNLSYDKSYMLNNNTNQAWRISPNYCGTGALCTGEITGFLLNKQDGSSLVNLTDGATFCESDFSHDIRIRTKESGSHESLRYTITGPNGTWANTENYVTYDSKQFWANPGEYVVKVELFSLDNLGGTKCDEKTIKFTVRSCNGVTIPTLECDNGDFKWEGKQQFVYSSKTQLTQQLPASFGNAISVKIGEVITSDSYTERVNRIQLDEKLKLVFLKDGRITGESDYTTDLEDEVKTAFFKGSLGTVRLDGGADELVIVHLGDANYGDNITNSPNSVDLRGICLMIGSVDPCANAGGDSDDDGVCDEEDCRPNDSNISKPGDACDDGNANTRNDVILADCSCAGTPIMVLLPNISIDDALLNEADGRATLTIGIDQPSTSDVLVDYKTTAGSAHANIDYTAASGTITIPAGQMFATVDFEILEDAIEEADERFNVVLSNAQGAIISGSIGTITIIDNDDPTTGGCDAAYQVNGNVITITGVTGAIRTVKVLDAAWNTVFTCDEWATLCNTTETVTIPTCGTYFVQVQTYADWNTPICNLFESVVIDTGCGNGYDCPGLAANIGDACDDGNPDTENDVVKDDCGCYGTPIVQPLDCPALNANIGDACDDFNPNTSNDLVQSDCTCAGTSGPSTCGVTYSVNGKDILVDNISGAIRSVKVLDENWETIFSCDDWTTACGSSETITVPSCGKYFIQVHTYADWSTTICDLFEEVVIDTDCGGNGNLPNVSIGNVALPEYSGVANLTVTLNAISATDVFVNFSTANGTATLNDDYTAILNGVVSIPAGQLTGTFVVSIEDDLTFEPTEEFTVVLSNPHGANIGNGTGVVTIFDNDAPATPPVISINDVVVNEADGTARIRVSLDRTSTDEVSVDFTTLDETAEFPLDYIGRAGTVFIPAGELFTTLLFTIVEDTIDEDDETFTVNLRRAQFGVIGDDSGTVTIIDNDDVGPIFDCPTLGANIGDACDDGDSNTNNDLVQADCSCAGMPMNNPTCAVTYDVNGRTITVNNVTGAITAVKIIDNNWGVLYSCDDWSTPCQTTEAFTVPECGTYFVQVQTYADWSTVICNLFETVIIDSDCGGGNPDPDCPTLNANIGDACDDGDADTENDVVKDDCTCAGTLIVTPPTCDNVIDGGKIAGDETITAGTDAAPITNATLPSGGSGMMEYQWLSATGRCPRFISQAIPGATQSTYDPGVLTETTYFVRCARRAGCTEDTDWVFGESNCVVKEVVQDFPNDVCANRNVSNATACRTGVDYGIWLQGEPFTISNGKFVEYTGGTALFTAHANGIGAVEVKFSGRVNQSVYPKNTICGDTVSTLGWYYYSSFEGTVGSHSISQRGPNFQIGISANNQNHDVFGGCGWFDTHDGLKGDINILLHGDQTACIGVQARMASTIFNAEMANGQVELDWTNNTGSVTDNFEVERSVDGVSFETIGTYDVISLDDTPRFYTSEDGSPLEGFNYYRLKVNYLDGTFEYSDIRTVKISDIEEFGLFPNPAREYVNISLKGYTGKDINIQLIDQMGQAVKSIQLENVEDSNYTIQLDGLFNGMYSFWIFAEGTKLVGKKMIVNKQY